MVEQNIFPQKDNSFFLLCEEIFAGAKLGKKINHDIGVKNFKANKYISYHTVKKTLNYVVHISRDNPNDGIIASVNKTRPNNENPPFYEMTPGQCLLIIMAAKEK